jgi:aryl-alcohol dehydrogenase-like predicted oxidoreductase
LDSGPILSNVGWARCASFSAAATFGGIGSAPAFFGHGESKEEAFELMDAAWALGLRRFDTADAYGGGRARQWIGDWLRATGNRPRITSKTFNAMEDGADFGLARERVLRQVETSLERLGVDRIDLYLTHEPDPDTPVEETFAPSQALLERGLIGAWGVSNVGATTCASGSRSARRRSSRTRTRCSSAATRRGDPALRRARDRVPGVQPARRRLADRASTGAARSRRPARG